MPEYHRLPDRSPYDYYRKPSGQRLLFPREEIKTIEKDGPNFFITSVFGCRFRVTSPHPELVMKTTLG